MRTKAKEQNFNRNYSNLMSPERGRESERAVSREKIEPNRGQHVYDLVKCFLLCYYESAGVRWACVCSFIMPMKCQQNKSLPRYCCGLKNIFCFFLFCSFCSFLFHQRTHVDWARTSWTRCSSFSVAHRCAVERCSLWFCYRCGYLYQLEFGEVLRHFLFINYGWYDSLRCSI